MPYVSIANPYYHYTRAGIFNKTLDMSTNGRIYIAPLALLYVC
jgi:hypothetical protein